jgi:hypothetical protein
MTAEEPNVAVANTIPAIKDLFISYLAKKQPRPAAWFSRIGELHPIKPSVKRLKNAQSVRFYEERCKKSRISPGMRLLPDFHSGERVICLNLQKNLAGLLSICKIGPTQRRGGILG